MQNIVFVFDWFLYFWCIKLMWNGGYIKHLFWSFETHSEMWWLCVVSSKSMRSDYCLFSLRGGEEVGGKEWRTGRRESEVENGGVGAAIMMEQQYCGNTTGQVCQPLYCHSSQATSYCAALTTLISLESLFITILVPNNTCNVTTAKGTSGHWVNEAASSSRSIYPQLHDISVMKSYGNCFLI